MNNSNHTPDMKSQTGTVLLILCVSLLVLAVLIAVAIIGSRREGIIRKQNESTEVTESITEETDVIDFAADTVPVIEQTELPVTEPIEDVEADAEPLDILPDFYSVSAGVIIKEFSSDVPVYSNTMDDYRVHTGVDISSPIGSDVYAAASGTVSAVWEDPMNGVCLSVSHSGGAVSTYCNLSKDTMDAMKPGMVVSGGMAVGTVGDTSLVEIADEPHIHYELSINGEKVNPVDYIDFTHNEENYAE